jgi:hypothetical protein
MKQASASVLRTLIRIRRLIRKGWTQKRYARNAEGTGVNRFSGEAVRYCLDGARFKALSELNCNNPTAVRVAIRNCIPGNQNAIRFNDSPTTKKSDVLRVLDCAIERAKEMEG